MSGGRRAAGWFPGDSNPDLRKYPGHPEASRRELFRKDRRIRELGARVFGAESLLEFISAVAHGKVGGNDLPWIVETIKDAADRYDVSPQRRHSDASELNLAAILGSLVTRTTIADRRRTKVSTVMSWIERYADFPQPALGAGTPTPRWWWPDVLAYCEEHHLPRYHQRDRRGRAKPVTPASISIDQVAAADWSDPARLEAAVTFWIDTKRSFNTREQYRTHITDWTTWCTAHSVHTGQAGRADVEAWRDSFITAGQTALTVAKKLQSLSSFYGFWLKRNVVAANPATSVTLPMQAPQAAVTNP